MPELNISAYNEMLKNGTVKDFNDLAKKLNVAESTLRSRLKTKGYKYNKDAKQIILVDATKNTVAAAKENKKPTSKRTEAPGMLKKDLDILEDLKDLRNRVQALELILKENHQSNMSNNLNISDFGEEFIYRTVKLYREVAKKYDAFCNSYKHISKQDILNQAVLEFIDKHHK